MAAEAFGIVDISHAWADWRCLSSVDGNARSLKDGISKWMQTPTLFYVRAVKLFSETLSELLLCQGVGRLKVAPVTYPRA